MLERLFFKKNILLTNAAFIWSNIQG